MVDNLAAARCRWSTVLQIGCCRKCQRRPAQYRQCDDAAGHDIASAGAPAHAPTGEIDLVLAELETGLSDPERKAELEEYLRLTGRELAGVTATPADVDSLARKAKSSSGAGPANTPSDPIPRRVRPVAGTGRAERGDRAAGAARGLVVDLDATLGRLAACAWRAPRCSRSSRISS